MSSPDNRVCFMANGVNVDQQEECNANARLVAAAPDMLALLKDTGCPAGGWTGMPDDIQPTVANCMKHGNCGCTYGEVIAKAEKP